MNLLTSRTRLLSGAAVGLGLTVVGAQPAYAACAVTATTVVCGTTATTDTTNAGGTPALDRHYPADTSAAAHTTTVSTGAAITGYGLSVTNTVGGTNALNVVNSGSITISAGNTATQGGSAALQVNAIGATPVNYSGTGSVTNLGAAGNGITFNMDGTGALTATVGGSVTSAVGGTGIEVDLDGATAGNATLTTATGTTVRGDFAGIWMHSFGTSTGNLTVTNNAAIRGVAADTLTRGIVVVGNGTGNVSVTNNGTIGLATDRVNTWYGILAGNNNAASAGTVSVGGSGAVFANAPRGIHAYTNGTGAVTVNYTGAVSNTGGSGVLVEATTGASTVTTGAVSGSTDGVVVTSTTGVQTITLNGVTTGTAGSGLVSTTNAVDPVLPATTPLARAITVGATGNVTGGTQAILLNGTATTTLTNNGIIGSTATGVAVNDAGGGITNVTNGTAGVINGLLALGGGDDTFTNNGRLNVSGVLDFGAGTDRLINSATGTIALAGNTSFVNIENFGTGTTQANAGRIDLNTFTLTGPAIVFTNAATGNVTTTGNAAIAGYTSISNSGTFTLGAGTLTVPAGNFTNANNSSFIVRSGASTLTGQTGFTNAGGQLLLNDGATNDTLTINSAFVASGNSRLQIDADATTADRLIINGNVTGTATNVLVNTVPGTVGFSTAGILIVDVTGAFTSVAGAFTTTAVQSTLVNYAIEKRGEDFYLTTLPSAGAFAPVVLGNLVMDSWYTGAQAFNAMAAARGGHSTGGGLGNFGIWLQPIYESERYGPTSQTFTQLSTSYTLPTRMRVVRQGLQGGIDFNMGMGAFGITAGYQQAEQSNGVPNQPVTGVTPLIAISPQADGWNVGAYGMFGGSVGLYGNALIKYDSNDVDLDGGAFTDLGISSSGESYGIDGEVGYRSAAEGLGFDLLAGLSYVNSEIDDFGAGGINYGFDSVSSFRGRLGARAVFNQYERLFIGAKLLHEFNGDTDLFLDSTSDAEVGNKGRGTWGRIEAGVGGSASMPFNVQAWYNLGDVKGWGITGGLRF